MKALKYITRYTFIFLLTFLIMTKVGPEFIKIGLGYNKAPMNKVQLQSLKVDYLNEHTKYIVIEMTIDNQLYKKIYRIEDNKHNELFDLFAQQNITQKNLRENLGKNSLPITLSSEQLRELQDAYALISKENHIETLSIGKFVIIGNKNGVIKRIFAFIFGLVIMVVISILFIFTLILLVGYLKEFKSKGKLPDLPNVIEDSIKGWRIILRLKSKE